MKFRYCKLRCFFLHIIRSSLLILLLLLIHLSGGISNAQPEIELGPRKIKLGPVNISPSFLIQEDYTDNVFREPTDEEGGFLTTISPEIKLLLTPKHKHNILLGYKGRYTKYTKFTSEETTDHTLETLAELNFRGGLSFRVWDVYAIDHESRGDSTSGEIEEFKSNTIAASSAYQLGERFEIEAEYSLLDIDFTNTETAFRDRQENAVSGVLFFKFLPKVSALLEYDFTQIDYDTADLNNNNNSLLGGFRWEIADRSRGEVKGGYIMKNYDSPAQSDFQGSTLSVNINHNFTESTALTLRSQRRVSESSIRGASYYTQNSIFGNLAHRFTGKISGRVATFYGINEYNTEITVSGKTDIREDKVLRALTGVRYNIKEWVETGLDYSYINRKSSFDVFDYTENTLSLHLNFVF